uniref:L-lactate dehydrogenase complex protein LldE n=1 Tax=Candidatus Kentrum eta TaxID=2126337 RepID=A0A450UT75_9GAMM|nr:MAG: L-lactate dehydrogenase complex protein LldE [Candidatus Kentron sp. H]VFJ89025.1 MAG: L-lactate dehydrogenase complex protein LldE [Candidatus Kentron sp. H]VFJ95738.1 MAG: L-lactate dehydrogenase complex protein LldE [Candidatus Kentron sp. H]
MPRHSEPYPNPRGSDSSPPPRVGFLITCLADFFRPTVGFASVKLLSDAGCRVEIPEGQTCCGQLAYNHGDSANARALAKQAVARFEGFDYVVAPSGSCATMLKRRYPDLLADDPEWTDRARGVSHRCFELTAFLVDIRAITRINTHYPGIVTYHDSCVGLRELGIRAQPRALLRSMAGLEIREMKHTSVCCGFGGAFCLKYPEISTRLVSDKVTGLHDSGADILLGGDLGCLLNIAGRLRRVGSGCHVYHVAEMLAGMTDSPIGGG